MYAKRVYTEIKPISFLVYTQINIFKIYILFVVYMQAKIAHQ